MRAIVVLIPLCLLVLVCMFGCSNDDSDEDVSESEAGDDDAMQEDDDSENDDDAAGDDDSVLDPDWYRRVVFMEIYVRSYYDSDGDGIGDLAGLKEKLDYLADLGIGGIWLMPIYPTPFIDSGYDVADYTGINPDYGTIEDFISFLDRAHELGIRVFLDGVFNHTSSEHPWFVESRSSRDNPKRDWYVWADEPLFQCPDSTPGGAVELAWTYDETTGQYYWHHFRERMPDLNWANTEVRKEIENVLRFWLDLGVDGFRLDVAHLYYQDATACQHHPQTFAIHHEFREVLDEYGDRAMVGELLAKPDIQAQYYGNGQDRLHMVFNFNLTYSMFASHFLFNPDYTQFSLDRTVGNFPDGAQNTLFFSNHDFYREYELFLRNDDRAKLMSALQLTLPGTPFLYYGQEIGMADGKEQIVDSRDVARTPMHWNGSQYAGFSTVEPWIDLAVNYETNNVESEDGNPDSLLNHFRRMVGLRNQSTAISMGAYLPVETSDYQVMAFFRVDNAESYLVLLNFAGNECAFQIDFTQTLWAGYSGQVIDVYHDEELAVLSEANRAAYALVLPAFGIAILKLQQ